MTTQANDLRTWAKSFEAAKDGELLLCRLWHEKFKLPYLITGQSKAELKIQLYGDAVNVKTQTPTYRVKKDSGVIVGQTFWAETKRAHIFNKQSDDETCKYLTHIELNDICRKIDIAINQVGTEMCKYNSKIEISKARDLLNAIQELQRTI